jgi:hypothetical protein
MLCPLPVTRLRIILLPREARAFPLAVHVLDEVTAEADVDLAGLLLVGSGSLSYCLGLG